MIKFSKKLWGGDAKTERCTVEADRWKQKKERNCCSKNC